MDTRKVNYIIAEASEKIASIEHDTVIVHLVMGEILGVQRQDEPQRYYMLARKVKSELEREYGIFLETVSKVGYRIVPKGNEINQCIGEAESGIKKIYRATAKTQYIRVDAIEDAEKRTKTIQIAQNMANMIGMLNAGQKRLITA
jgi:hypothetical protein